MATSKKQEYSFENWYDIFVDCLRITQGYKGPIDTNSALEEYNNGRSPEDAAESLMAELI
ncbi:MAG TPA: hypothetical protein VGQ59_11875 [Cyclobacteriaceae bacterium]|nr:hypothetical protein [Cyclobacteriaceae bacterium]